MNTSTPNNDATQALLEEVISDIVDEFIEVVEQDETIKQKIVTLIVSKAERYKNKNTPYVS